MANIKSSKKSIKVIAKKTLANHEYKAQVKNLIKSCETAIMKKDKEKALEEFKKLQKSIDRAFQKGLAKRNTVDREKKRLNSKIKEMK